MFFKSSIQLALSLALTHVTDAIIWPSAGILITDTVRAAPALVPCPFHAIVVH